mmetsp:Transcript_6764/g.11018  ORF Transcript_6764/g.11018 Transcript_6764/m.11018 type:complete len:111 (+) Transcript_6764:1232-1564(+)
MNKRTDTTERTPMALRLRKRAILTSTLLLLDLGEIGGVRGVKFVLEEENSSSSLSSLLLLDCCCRLNIIICISTKEQEEQHERQPARKLLYLCTPTSTTGYRLQLQVVLL